MPKTFKIGEHVRWNSEAGRVTGIIIKKITSDMKFKGYVHHASQEAPQYLIKSDKTEHVAIHKGTARRLIPPRTRKSSRTTDETEETMTNDERIATGVEFDRHDQNEARSVNPPCIVNTTSASCSVESDAQFALH